MRGSHVWEVPEDRNQEELGLFQCSFFKCHCKVTYLGQSQRCWTNQLTNEDALVSDPVCSLGPYSLQTQVPVIIISKSHLFNDSSKSVLLFGKTNKQKHTKKMKVDPN